MTKSKYKTNLFYKSDYSTTFFLAYNQNISVTEPGLITKKDKLLKISLYFIFHFL